MGYNDAKLQEVKWKHGSSLDNVAAHSSETTETHAKEITQHIKNINPGIEASVSQAGSGYRVNIADDDSLNKFEKEFPAVKLDPQRQHMARVRKGQEKSSEGRAL